MAVKSSQHIGFWLGVIAVGFLLGPVMRSGTSMEQFVKTEIHQTREALGETVAARVVGFASGIFIGTPLGMISQTANGLKHSKEERDLGGRVAGPVGLAMSSMYNSYLQGLMLQAYVMAMRFAIVMVWFVILAPLLFAAVYDGFMQRKIKRAEFGALRPATFALASLLVIPLLVLPLVYLVVPFSISPLLAPAWALIVAIPLSVLISNTQPLFGR